MCWTTSKAEASQEAGALSSKDKMWVIPSSLGDEDMKREFFKTITRLNYIIVQVDEYDALFKMTVLKDHARATE